MKQDHRIRDVFVFCVFFSDFFSLFFVYFFLSSHIYIFTVLNCTHVLNAKFSGLVDSGAVGGELFKLAAVHTKISLGVGSHENGISSENGSYITSRHMDGGRADHPKVDSNGILRNLHKMDGVRVIFGIGTAEANRLFQFFGKRYSENLLRSYNLGQIWVFLFNGVIRHVDRQPAVGNGIRVYHQGSSTGGSCFNVIMTLTRDVNKEEAEWIMSQAAKCLDNILSIFSNFCS